MFLVRWLEDEIEEKDTCALAFAVIVSNFCLVSFLDFIAAPSSFIS